MTIREVREWFLRHIKISTPYSKRDREATYNKTYTTGDLEGKYNTFLKGDYPSQDTFNKLFDSITFKLNPEDTAFEQQQGLVQLAKDDNVLARTSIDNGIYENDASITGGNGFHQADTTTAATGTSPYKYLTTNNFATVVRPHQLTNLHTYGNIDTDSSNVPYGTAETARGITLTPYTTTVSQGKRKNYTVETAIDTAQDNLEFNASGELATKGASNTSLNILTGIHTNDFGQVTQVSYSTFVIEDGVIKTITTQTPVSINPITI